MRCPSRALSGTRKPRSAWNAQHPVNLVDLVKRTRFGKAVASSPLRSRHWRESWQAARTLWFAYGHLQTVRSKAAIDRTGRPVPWYTYPAIEYLKQFDFAETSVFEYGSGNSTPFFGRSVPGTSSALKTTSGGTPSCGPRFQVTVRCCTNRTCTDTRTASHVIPTSDSTSLWLTDRHARLLD